MDKPDGNVLKNRLDPEPAHHRITVVSIQLVLRRCYCQITSGNRFRTAKASTAAPRARACLSTSSLASQPGCRKPRFSAYQVRISSGVLPNRLVDRVRDRWLAPCGSAAISDSKMSCFKLPKKSANLAPRNYAGQSKTWKAAAHHMEFAMAKRLVRLIAIKFSLPTEILKNQRKGVLCQSREGSINPK
jgi:hypothetical protein